MSIQDQIALLRGAACVPKEPDEHMDSMGDVMMMMGATDTYKAMLAATPPAYTEALAAVIEGCEAMQKDAEQDPLQGAVDWLASAMVRARRPRNLTGRASDAC